MQYNIARKQRRHFGLQLLWYFTEELWIIKHLDLSYKTPAAIPFSAAQKFQLNVLYELLDQFEFLVFNISRAQQHIYNYLSDMAIDSFMLTDLFDNRAK